MFFSMRQTNRKDKFLNVFYQIYNMKTSLRFKTSTRLFGNGKHLMLKQVLLKIVCPKLQPCFAVREGLPRALPVQNLRP